MAGPIEGWRRRSVLALVVAAVLAPGLARARIVRRQPLVMLDAGHGGVDPGCIGVGGSYEKTVTLATAQALADELRRSGRYRVAFTRDDDVFIPLAERVALARAASADLFLSIHADAIPDHATRGASVFTLADRPSDKAAAKLAERENRADQVGGVRLAGMPAEVGSILYDLARRHTSNQSIAFARDLVAELGAEVPMLENSHRSAGFAVLRAPDVPAALVELGCLSNAAEERLLLKPAYRRRLAVRLARAIDAYFGTPGHG